jgi:hypothetical protein
MQLSSSGTLGSFVTGVFSGLTRSTANLKPSQCSVICLVVLGGIAPDEVTLLKEYGSQLTEQTLIVVSNSLISKDYFRDILCSQSLQAAKIDPVKIAL